VYCSHSHGDRGRLGLSEDTADSVTLTPESVDAQVIADWRYWLCFGLFVIAVLALLAWSERRD